MTPSPTFLSEQQALRLHERLIHEFGGSLELRDRGLLQSALAQPSAGFGGVFLHEDMPTMAAAYLFHLVKNHPFVDGNKRTGATAARVFLLMNEVTFDPPEGVYEALTLGVASGEIDKDEVIEFFRKHVGGLDES